MRARVGVQRAALAPQSAQRLGRQRRLRVLVRGLRVDRGSRGIRRVDEGTIVLAALFSLGAHGLMTLNDFKSMDGDRALGLRSIPVMLGERKARCSQALRLHQPVPSARHGVRAVRTRMDRGRGDERCSCSCNCRCSAKLARDPQGIAPWYCASAIPPFCWSMLAGSACGAFRGVLEDGRDRRRRQLRWKRCRGRLGCDRRQRDLARTRSQAQEAVRRRDSAQGDDRVRHSATRSSSARSPMRPSSGRAARRSRWTSAARSPREDDYIIMLTREVLDRTLRAKAQDAGAELREAAFVSQEVQSDGKIRVKIRYRDEREEYLNCDALIGADGAGSAVAKSVGRPAVKHASAIQERHRAAARRDGVLREPRRAVSRRRHLARLLRLGVPQERSRRGRDRLPSRTRQPVVRVPRGRQGARRLEAARRASASCSKAIRCR